MSNTRHAKEGARLRQERYCSSAEFDRGLMLHLVAKRCEMITAPADRELIYWLQAVSHEPGSLAQLACELTAKYADRIGTPVMFKLRLPAGKSYTPDQVKQVREEIPDGLWDFPLRGEVTQKDVFLDDGRADRKRATYPTSYPVSAFHGRCAAAAAALDDYLTRLCLDPAMPFTAPWYFPDLIGTLREIMTARAGAIRDAFVETEISREVFATIEYGIAVDGLVVIEGLERIGKTKAAKTWCDMHPGRARYVQVPSTNDDTGFFRAIARALGVSASLKLKAIELRDKIEDALLRSRLMLVLDEAHYIWPQTEPRFAHTPQRLNWILTALVNQEIPVAFVATPQFTITQQRISDICRWRSGQFVGRIAEFRRLPETVAQQDMLAIAKALLPEGDADSLEALVIYARRSMKYLAAIEQTVKRARFVAQQGNRVEVNRADIKRAVREMLPSETALAEATQVAQRPARRDSMPAREMQPVVNRSRLDTLTTTL
jgi:hypothetical protein